MVDAQAAAPGIERNDARSSPVYVLLLGDAHDSEMAPIAGELASIAGSETRVAADVDSACRSIDTDGWHPDLIVVLQTWSDQFSPGDVLKLLSHAPLARFVCAAGAWCDSDSRTRLSWPISVRIRAVDAPGRIVREIGALRSSMTASDAGDSLPYRGMPLTASRAEIFAAELVDEPVAGINVAQVVVESPDRAWKQMVEQALGISPPLDDRKSAAAVIVFDVDPWSEIRRKSLQTADSHWPAARIVACSGDSAIDLTEELKDAGADAVWFKLSPLTALRRIIGAAASTLP